MIKRFLVKAVGQRILVSPNCRLIGTSPFICSCYGFSSVNKFETSNYIDVGASQGGQSTEHSARGSLKYSLKSEEIRKAKEGKGRLGRLTIVPTPLGNLFDISLHQYEALLEADVIASEDTRITGMLLKLLKARDIKGVLQTTFQVDHLTELMEIGDAKGSLLSSNSGKSDDLEEFDELQELESAFTSERLTKEQRIQQKVRELRQNARTKLEEEDTFNYFDEAAEEEPNDIGGGIYGLDDELIRYLRGKIALSKRRKGRGILISYHKYNEDSRINKLVKMLSYGLNIVLVSDAGTPTISDPGYRIVDSCLNGGVYVESVPGPNSVTLALSKSGYSAEQFTFAGFLPKTQAEREEVLLRVKEGKKTAIAFESVNRLFKTLLSVEKIFGSDQEIFLSFEMTKIHEKYFRGGVRELYEELNNPDSVKASHLKGELTLIIPPYSTHSTGQNSEKKGEESMISIEDMKIVELEPSVIAQILHETLDTSDQELANIVGEIFKLSRSRSMQLIGVTKHFHKRTRNWDEFLPNYSQDIKRKTRRTSTTGHTQQQQDQQTDKQFM